MGIADNGRLLCLSEHLPEGDDRNDLAADQIAEHIARPHRGKLIGIAHHDKAGARAERRQQRPHELQIHHGHLVHDDSICLQRFFLPLLEGGGARLLVPAHAKAAMDGLGISARHLTHALGSATRGRQQQHIQSHALQHRENAADSGGLARAGTARQQQHAFLCRERHRFLLGGGIGYALLLFHLRKDAVHILSRSRRAAEQQAQLLRHIGLRLKHLIEIAGAHICHLPLDHLMPLDESIQCQLHLFPPHVNELGSCRDELLPWQEYVSVVLIMTELKQHRAAQPLLRIPGEAEGKGNLIAAGKIHAAILRRQQVGVILHPLQRIRAEAFIQLHTHRHRQLVATEKFHQPLHAHAAPKALCDLPRPLGSDTLDAGEALRLFRNDGKALDAEAGNDLLCRGGTDALDGTGGKVMLDLLFLLRQKALRLLRFELRTMLGMLLPNADSGKPLPLHNARNAAHHCRQFSRFLHKAQHSIAVLLVAENDLHHRSLDSAALRHHSLLLFFHFRKQFLLLQNLQQRIFPLQDPHHTALLLLHAAVQHHSPRCAAVLPPKMLQHTHCPLHILCLFAHRQHQIDRRAEILFFAKQGFDCQKEYRDQSCSCQ